MLSSWLPSSPFSIDTNNKCAHYLFSNRDFSVITSWPMFPFTAVSDLPLAKTSKGRLRHVWASLLWIQAPQVWGQAIPPHFKTKQTKKTGVLSWDSAMVGSSLSSNKTTAPRYSLWTHTHPQTSPMSFLWSLLWPPQAVLVFSHMGLGNACVALSERIYYIILILCTCLS